MIVKILLCLLIQSYGLAIATQLEIAGFVALQTEFANLLGTVEQVVEGSENSRFLFHAYRGLPFAEPPIGKLRWQDPVLKRPLPRGVLYNATQPGSPCPQWVSNGNETELIGSEDCLYADVFISVQQREGVRGPLKILVFFHGGGFIVNANRNMLPLPFLQQNVIVIIFNYRISIFGYLSTGTSDLPGNYGPLDQITLLKWVQLYGGDFGGDTSDVTVFGSSIGAVSIHYLLLTNLAQGLFHKAIMESGSALCERSLVPNPMDVAIRLGSHLGCGPNPRQLVDCLQARSTRELMTAAKALLIQWVLPSVLGPVIDKHSRPAPFLADYPEKLPVVNRVPTIAGITRDEGLTAFVKLSKGYYLQQMNDLNFIERVILPHYLNLIMRPRKGHLSRATFIDNLSKEVTFVHMEQLKQDPIQTLVGILGDLWINTCHKKTVESLCLANTGTAMPIYSYLFTHHDAGISPSEIDKQIKEFHQAGINHLILDNGVAHTEEILYLLQEHKDLDQLDIPRNRQMSKLLSLLWTDFARGN